ncbi:cysteine-rich CWC family protein [Ideonella sp.]|uniref:cysteine-rich CWC family protein n=1 Tax=Ideonella sp. TaxID=1929293 RepID=UPI003BB7352D
MTAHPTPAQTGPLASAAHHCPVCQGPNDCQAARTGGFDTPCWCAQIKVTPEALALVPPAQVGKACICRACIAAAAAATPAR